MTEENNKLEEYNVRILTKAPVLINCGPFLDGKAKRRERRKMERRNHEKRGYKEKI